MLGARSRCSYPGCPPGPDTEEGGRREAPGRLLHMRCVGGAVSWGRRLGKEGSPPPARPQGHGAPGWMEMQGAAQRTPRPHLLWSWPPVPCMLTRAHTAHTVHMHTHGHTHLYMFNAHSLTRTHTAHTHSSVWHSHTRTLLCAHTHVICALISHTCTASHAHADMCSGTWPLPPPAQAQPTRSEANAGAQPQGLPTPNPALRPPPGHRLSPGQHACPCTFRAETRPGHPGALEQEQRTQLQVTGCLSPTPLRSHWQGCPVGVRAGGVTLGLPGSKQSHLRGGGDRAWT